MASHGNKRRQVFKNEFQGAVICIAIALRGQELRAQYDGRRKTDAYFDWDDCSRDLLSSHL